MRVSACVFMRKKQKEKARIVACQMVGKDYRLVLNKRPHRYAQFAPLCRKTGLDLSRKIPTRHTGEVVSLIPKVAPLKRTDSLMLFSHPHKLPLPVQSRRSELERRTCNWPHTTPYLLVC